MLKKIPRTYRRDREVFLAGPWKYAASLAKLSGGRPGYFDGR